MNIKNLTKNDTLIAFLAALCLFLSAIEYVIPKPLPFMRLGLANLPILISLYILKPRDTLFLVLLKVIGQGFISGTLFSYIVVFSFFGSYAAAFIMLISHRIGKSYISSIGIGILGALANAGTQIIISSIMLFGESARYIAPILIINACVTGFLLGIIATRFMTTSVWFNTVVTEIKKDSIND